MPIPEIQVVPIYSLPYLYINGLNISLASASPGQIVAIAAGQARDSNDIIDMPIGFPDLRNNITPAPFFLNSSVLGAGGLDTLPMQGTTYYAIWEIGDSRYYNPVSVIASQINNIYPLVPFGYDSLRLLGFISTNSTPAFTSSVVINMLNAKSFYFQPTISVLSGGNATTFTTISLTSVPNNTSNILTIVILDVTFTPAAAGDTVQFRPFNQSVIAGSNNIPTITGIAAGVPQQQQIQVISLSNAGAQKIDYKVTSASDSVNVNVAGYTITTT